MLTTDGTLLGGRLCYAQPAKGFRSGIEPVLLAAAVPARPGERVLEAGCGAGAALLCVAARVAGLRGTGVEIDAAMAALAAANAAANGFDELRIVRGAIEGLRTGCRTGDERSIEGRTRDDWGRDDGGRDGRPSEGRADDGRARDGEAGRTPASGAGAMEGETADPVILPPFDHAMANPPYHPPAGTRSAVAARETAKRGSAALIDTWVARMVGMLRDRGSLTLIVPAWLVPAALAALERADCGCSVLFPLWPMAGRPAKLVLLRGVRRGRSPLRVMAGLALHREDGGFTDAVRAILERVEALDIAAG